MFQILKDPNFDFMGKRNVFLTVSLVVIIASIGVLAVKGLDLGTEFTGGTELRVKFAERPDVSQIRADLAAGGVANAQVTTIGDSTENEVYIRVGLGSEDQEDPDDIAKVVVEILTPASVEERRAAGMLNLNQTSRRDLHDKLFGVAGLTDEQAGDLTGEILDLQRETAIFGSVEDVANVAGMTPETMDYLRKQTFAGPLSLRGQSYIGPVIGRELMRKALFAILGSLAGMLVYIWIRFEFQWGLAAVVALTHDTLITLGLFSLFGMEMTLPVVAAFLTLIGYSVNDTVVVFDRIREDLKLKGSTMDLESIISLAINQTLSRTIITSGLTWIVVVSLFLFGGAALNAFAFVLVVGVVVGTYSSIYVASPVLLMWRQVSKRRRRVAKKVRSRPA